MEGLLDQTNKESGTAYEILNTKGKLVLSPEREPLANYIPNTSDGKCIVLAYSKKNKLNGNHRKLLVHLVISRERDFALKKLDDQGCIEDFSIPPELLQKYADEIVKMFPSELVGTYYVPYTDKTRPQAGRLYLHYTFLKRELISDGVLKKKTKATVSNPALNCEAEQGGSNDTESSTNEEIWLKDNIEPEDVLIDYWKKTFESRRGKLMNKSNSITAADYISTYKCLKLQIAKKMVSIDFELLYPNKTEEFENRWKYHLKFLFISLIAEKKSIFKAGDDNETRASFLTIQSKDSDLQDAILLYFIPHLLKPVPIKRRANGTFRPSATEIRQSFLLLVENENGVRSSLTSLLSQPSLIFVGNLEELSSYYVAFYDTLYKVDTPLEALIFAFQLIFALDLEYSPIAENIWRLLQVAAFDIRIPGERIATQVTTLIGRLALPNNC